MSVKKQNPNLGKPYKLYKELPEEFLDETGVDSYFYHNIFDISQSQHRIVRVSRDSKQKIVCHQVVPGLPFEDTSKLNLRKEVNISKRELTSLVDSLREFLETFDHASKNIQVPLPKPKVEIGTKKSKTISLLITITISLNIQIDKLVYRTELETTVLAYLPPKSLNYTVIN